MRLPFGEIGRYFLKMIGLRPILQHIVFYSKLVRYMRYVITPGFF